MANKKDKALRSSISIRDIIYEQEEQIRLGPHQSQLISTVKKNRGLKGGSMVNIIGELEDSASSSSQTPLVPHANDDRPTTKRKRGPSKCLKTHGWVFKTLGSSWRTYKSWLKKQYFKENMALAYNMKNCPCAVPHDYWKILVQFWSFYMIKA
ncbi:hypothetical protein Ahy_B08g091403 [Arachis hypogaea]|uniref:Uncharacterized protein n=1 Tax=Arachis hypogaea TaxID=3818 RepID=A0A444Y229_ARAHY|nr:hypothetical protein Ahy_B08g091403 [Arachis hypogaea]